MIPVTMLDGTAVELTPGGQNVLLKQMVEDFCPRFTPRWGSSSTLVMLARTTPYLREGCSRRLALNWTGTGSSLTSSSSVFMQDRNWLLLMEAASSHGPVDAKRYGELRKLFGAASARLVFVSCFPSRAGLRKYLTEIAWDTHVWCADSPTHVIHLNGDELLGPR